MKTWILNAWYELPRDEALDGAMMKAVGIGAGSSGAGFGDRDLSWYFDTEETAKEAEKRLKAFAETMPGRFQMLLDEDVEDEDVDES